MRPTNPQKLLASFGYAITGNHVPNAATKAPAALVSGFKGYLQSEQVGGPLVIEGGSRTVNLERPRG
jgi:hypothetical protein